jgi:hypothetical protein
MVRPIPRHAGRHVRTWWLLSRRFTQCNTLHGSWRVCLSGWWISRTAAADDDAGRWTTAIHDGWRSCGTATAWPFDYCPTKRTRSATDYHASSWDGEHGMKIIQRCTDAIPGKCTDELRGDEIDEARALCYELCCYNIANAN